VRPPIAPGPPGLITCILSADPQPNAPPYDYAVTVVCQRVAGLTYDGFHDFNDGWVYRVSANWYPDFDLFSLKTAWFFNNTPRGHLDSGDNPISPLRPLFHPFTRLESINTPPRWVQFGATE
jgi:hypothetical protein